MVKGVDEAQVKEAVVPSMANSGGDWGSTVHPSVVALPPVATLETGVPAGAVGDGVGLYCIQLFWKVVIDVIRREMFEKTVEREVVRLKYRKHAYIQIQNQINCTKLTSWYRASHSLYRSYHRPFRSFRSCRLYRSFPYSYFWMISWYHRPFWNFSHRA